MSAMITIERTAARDLVERIRAEYREMPGLCLTKQQMRRLWALDTVLCDATVDELVTSGFLRCRSDSSFVRAA
jgi:hypothetical protein